MGGVWLGLDNTSWSASRLKKPVRHWQVTFGNRQARWAARLFTKLAKKGIPVAIENPSSSRVWLTPWLRGLLARFGFQDVDMCSFGAPGRNRTRILFANWNLHGLKIFCCHGKGGICSFTGRKHVEHKRGRTTTPTSLFRYVVSRL